MSTSADAVRRWRMCSAPSARYRPPGEDPAHAADPPDAGHGLLRYQAMRDQRVDEAARPFVMRVQEPRRLCAGEHAAVETRQGDPFGLAARPPERLERPLSPGEMGDHRGASVTRARSAWR